MILNCCCVSRNSRSVRKIGTRRGNICNACSTSRRRRLGYQLLASVHEHDEDFDAAGQCHREGLRLATNSVGGLPVVAAPAAATLTLGSS